MLAEACVGHSKCVYLALNLCCIVLYVTGTLSYTEVGGRMMKRMCVKNLFQLH